ncbi:hypothetical protein BH23ACT5_BH23ACT5_09480 [soil metagenome]
MDNDREHATRRVDSEEIVDARTWSPAQFVAGLVGFLLVVLGGIALARLGFTGSITGESTTIAGVSATRLWAIIMIVLGLILLGVASSPYRVRGGLMTMGLLFAAFGVIVAVEPSPFGDTLGVDRTSGVIWLVTGLVLVVVAWVSPTIISRHRRTGSVRDEREQLG